MKRLHQTAWMGAALIGAWSASQPRAAKAQSVSGLQSAPLVPSGRLTLNREGTWKIVTSNTVTGLEYSIDAINADVPTLLKALGEASHTRIIVSDDVHARLPYFRNADNALPTLISRIATATHLAVGKIGTDTYLIVNAPPAAAQAPLIIAPYATPFSPYAPRVEPVPLPGSNAKPDRHRDWKPFTFNGDTVYMMPAVTSTYSTIKGGMATSKTYFAVPSPSETPDTITLMLPAAPSSTPQPAAAPAFAPRASNPGAITPVK